MKWYWMVVTSVLLISTSVLSEESDEASPAEEGVVEESGQKESLPRIGHVDLEKLTQKALVAEQRQSEVVWLDVEYPVPEGSTSSPQMQQVLALQRASQKPQRQGAVLVVPGKGQHADWPDVVRPIRRNLPEAGWYTLSVTLPSISHEKIPERELPVKQFDEVELSAELKDALNRKATKNSEGSDEDSQEEGEAVAKPEEEATGEVSEMSESPDKPVDIDLGDKDKELTSIPYQDKALAHVLAGMNYLQQQGYQNIILLAYRSSASIALQYIKQRQGMFSDKGFALVLVDPIFDEVLQINIAEALGENFRPPVLEMVNSDEDESLVKERIASARVAGASNYMQVAYAFSLSDGSPKTMVRRIRYWLDKYAPGMTLSN